MPVPETSKRLFPTTHRMTALSSFKKLAGQLMLGPRGELGVVTESHTFQVHGELTKIFAGYTVHYLKEYAASLDDHRFRIGLIYNSSQPHPWGAETLRFTDEVVRMIYPMSSIGSKGLTEFQKKKRENSIYFGTELLLTYSMKDVPGVPIFLPVLYDRGTMLVNYENQTSSTMAVAEPLDTSVIEVLNLVGPAMAARKNLDVFVTLKERLANTLIKHDARRPVEMKLMESARAPSAVPASGGPSSIAFPPISTPAPTATAPTGMSGPVLSADPNSKQWYNTALHDATCEKLSRYLLQPREYADTERIRQFMRFRDLTASQQNEISSNCPLYRAPPNTLLLERGSTDQWNLYLLEGKVELKAEDGERKELIGGTDNARNAVAALKPRKFAVTALTPVRFLWIHESIVADIQQRLPGSKLELL